MKDFWRLAQCCWCLSRCTGATDTLHTEHATVFWLLLLELSSSCLDTSLASPFLCVSQFPCSLPWSTSLPARSASSSPSILPSWASSLFSFPDLDKRVFLSNVSNADALMFLSRLLINPSHSPSNSSAVLDKSIQIQVLTKSPRKGCTMNTVQGKTVSPVWSELRLPSVQEAGGAPLLKLKKFPETR